MGSEYTQYVDGMIPFKWESVKKTLTSLIGGLPPQASHVVLYVISAPSSSLTTSKDFRQLSSVITNFQSSINGLDGRTLFHFVPRSLVYQSVGYPDTRHLGLERLTTSVYDRLLRRVDRNTPRQIFKRQMLRTERFTPSPSFTLARESPRFSFLLVDWPPASDNAADRHTFLHVAYQLSSSNEWLFISGIDERGEAHTLKAWYVGASDSEDEVFDKVTSRVMTFAWDFAARSATEWSVVIARSGTMVESELMGECPLSYGLNSLVLKNIHFIAWEKCLHREVISQDVAIHVTIACVEQDTPLAVLPSPLDSKLGLTISHASAMQKASFQDLASSAQIVIPYHRTPLLAQNAHDMGPSDLAMESEPEAQHSPYGSVPRPPQVGLLPLASAYILHALPSSDHSVATSLEAEDLPASMASIQVHIMRTGGSPTSSSRKPLRVLLQDITKNYCELAALARERWAITSSGMVPFHLAAVEIMKRVVTYTKD